MTASESDKKKRALNEKVENLDALIQEQKTNSENANAELLLWKKVFANLTAPDSNRPEKPRELPWCEYFKNMLGEDVFSAPTAFASPDMDLEEATIQVGVYITKLKKNAAVAGQAAGRAEAKKDKAVKTAEKKESKVREKVEKIIDHPELIEQKISKDK